MIALAQGSAGLALVMCLILLSSRQVAAAAIFLSVQSAAVAVAVSVLHRPLMAIPPVLLAGGIWLIRQRTPMLDASTAPAGGAKLSIAIGMVLTILCQSQGSLALPSAIVLLSVLLAAARAHPLMQIIALVGVQNGLVLAGGLGIQSPAHPVIALSSALAPFACLLLPLPLVWGLLMPALSTTHGGIPEQRLGAFEVSRAETALTAVQSYLAAWFKWIDLGLALGLFAVTLMVPLDGLASVFAPLLGLDGVLRSCARRNRR